MASATRRWTREEVLTLPDDGKRYELVDGELLVTPAPSLLHQRAVVELFRLLDPYVRDRSLGLTFPVPGDLTLGADQLVQPDLFVIPPPEHPGFVEWADVAVPLLIAEVLSPSTARYDRFTKRRRYQRSGVGTYWIVDLDARLVEVWRPEDERPAVLNDALEWEPSPGHPALVIDLPDFFRDVFGEPRPR